MSTKVRLTIDVSEELDKMLESIARDTGTTKTEVFRKAMALIDVTHKVPRPTVS